MYNFCHFSTNMLWISYGYGMGILWYWFEVGQLRIEKPTPNNVLRTATGSPIGQSPSPVKGREKKPNPGPSQEK